MKIVEYINFKDIPIYPLIKNKTVNLLSITNIINIFIINILYINIMSTNIFGMTTIAFLHEIFTILWIGGMSVLLMAILPALKTEFPEKKKRKAVINQIQLKLSVIALSSIAGMIITGLLMTARIVLLSSIFDFSTSYTTILSIKHILTIIMIVIVFIRRYYMDRLFGMKNPKKEVYSFILLLSNVILGWIVLFLSAYMVKLNV